MLKIALAALAAVFVASCGGGEGAGASSGASLMGEGTGVASAAPQAAKAKPPPALVAGEVSVVNSTTEGDQRLGTVGATSDGGYVVAWLSDESTLLIQAYHRSGHKAGRQTLIPISIGASSAQAAAQALAQASFAVLRDGSVVVLYRVSRDVDLGGGMTESRMGVYFQHFDRRGVLLAPEAEIDSLAYSGPKGPYMGIAAVLPLSDGGFVADWAVVRYSARFGSVSTLSLRWFDSNGQAVGAPAQVGDFPELLSRIAPDLSGGFVLTIVRTDNFYNRESSVQSFDASHAFVEVVPPSSRTLRILPLDGAYVLFTADSTGASQRLLDAQGNALGAAVPLPAFPADARELADGTYVTVATSGNGVFEVRWYAADMSPLRSPLEIDTPAVAPQLASLADPGVAAAWTGTSANSGTDVYTQRFIESSARKACLEMARQQHLVGRARKAFMDACVGQDA